MGSEDSIFWSDSSLKKDATKQIGDQCTRHVNEKREVFTSFLTQHYHLQTPGDPWSLGNPKLIYHSKSHHIANIFLWLTDRLYLPSATIRTAYCTFALLAPISTGNTVVWNAPIVNPNLLLTLLSQPSGILSSVNSVLISFICPPKIVSRVDELDSSTLVSPHQPNSAPSKRTKNIL